MRTARRSSLHFARASSLAVILALCAAPGLSTAFAAAQTQPSRAPSTATIVVCAPGYPGGTEQAQPAMDAFAAAAASAAGWNAGALRAVYDETEDKGLSRLSEKDAAFALVTLPFFLAHGDALKCAPRLQAVQASGPDETWSLVAKKGAIGKASDLDGWEVTGRAGFFPPFVKGTVLGDWGVLPQSVRITFASRALPALRRAAAGEKVAVVLEGEEASALASLPFAKDLEVVAQSKPAPGNILCSLEGRLDPARGDDLVEALLVLQKSADGAEALKGLRMVRFAKVDMQSLAAARDRLSHP
ncbi:MAG TPA: hypothetical protein VNI57_14030 [Candidatus Saccharimonadales bacterium]|nr:hypothetical protein [Candidatus Saccharimonadales bacterium]